MKYRLCLLAMLFAFAGYSQKNAFKPYFQFGLSAAQVEGDAYGGFNKPGGVIGIFTERGFDKRWSGALGFQIAQKGSFKGPNSNQGDQSTYRISLAYAEIPLSLKYRINQLQLFAGASFGVLFYAKESNQNGEINGTPPFKRTEIATFLGASYDLNKRFFLSLSLGSSVLPIRDLVTGPSWLNKNDGQYNLWIYTQLGIRIAK